MALNKENADLLKRQLTAELKKARHSGLVEGSKAICDVILKKATNDEMPVDERLREVIKFCKVSLGHKDLEER